MEAIYETYPVLDWLEIQETHQVITDGRKNRCETALLCCREHENSADKWAKTDKRLSPHHKCCPHHSPFLSSSSEDDIVLSALEAKTKVKWLFSRFMVFKHFIITLEFLRTTFNIWGFSTQKSKTHSTDMGLPDWKHIYPFLQSKNNVKVFILNELLIVFLL